MAGVLRLGEQLAPAKPPKAHPHPARRLASTPCACALRRTRARTASSLPPSWAVARASKKLACVRKKRDFLRARKVSRYLQKWSARGRLCCFWRWRLAAPTLCSLTVVVLASEERGAGTQPSIRVGILSSGGPPASQRCSLLGLCLTLKVLDLKMLFSEKVYPPGLVQESDSIAEALFFCGGQKIPNRRWRCLLEEIELCWVTSL